MTTPDEVLTAYLEHREILLSACRAELLPTWSKLSESERGQTIAKLIEHMGMEDTLLVLSALEEAARDPI